MHAVWCMSLEFRQHYRMGYSVDYWESDTAALMLRLLSAMPLRYVDYHVLVNTLFKEKRVSA